MKIEVYGAEGRRVAKFFCPACRIPHEGQIEGEGAVWSYDGNAALPTFTGRLRTTYFLAPYFPVICDAGILEGEIIYSADSSHIYQARAVVLPDIPETFLEEEQMQED